jgi:hypothetical protein
VLRSRDRCSERAASSPIYGAGASRVSGFGDCASTCLTARAQGSANTKYSAAARAFATSSSSFGRAFRGVTTTG